MISYFGEYRCQGFTYDYALQQPPLGVPKRSRIRIKKIINVGSEHPPQPKPPQPKPMYIPPLLYDNALYGKTT